MRISLLGLLLFVPAWTIAFLVPHPMFQVVRTTHHHDVVSNEVRQVRRWAVHQLIWNPRIKYEQYDVMGFWPGTRKPVDSWGNPYVFIELGQTGPNEPKSTFHLYSCGEDGESQTDGNDPDDINSWSYDRNRFYRQRMRWIDSKQRLWRTIWMAPLIWAFSLLILKWLRGSHAS